MLQIQVNGIQNVIVFSLYYIYFLQSYSNYNANVIIFSVSAKLLQIQLPFNVLLLPTRNSVQKYRCFFHWKYKMLVGKFDKLKNFEGCVQPTSVLYHHWWLLDFLQHCLPCIGLCNQRSRSYENVVLCNVTNIQKQKYQLFMFNGT